MSRCGSCLACFIPGVTLLGAGLLAAVLAISTISCTHTSKHEIEEIAHYDTPGWAHDVTIDGNLAYVSDRQGGFLIFDSAAAWTAPKIFAPVKDVIALASNSGQPLLASRFEGIVMVTPSGEVMSRISNGDIANAVVTRDNFAFAAYGAHGLMIARIEERDLCLVSDLPTPGWSHDIKLWGNRALMADWNYGLRIVDISKPERPIEIGRLPTRATAICISLGKSNGRQIAAVAEGHGGVSIVGFNEGGQPFLIARNSLGLRSSDAPHPEAGGWAHGVALCGRYLFVANWKRGLAILDVQDPAHPRLVKELPSSGTSLGIKAEATQDGNILVYLADGEAGLRVLRFYPA